MLPLRHSHWHQCPERTPYASFHSLSIRAFTYIPFISLLFIWSGYNITYFIVLMSENTPHLVWPPARHRSPQKSPHTPACRYTSSLIIPQLDAALLSPSISPRTPLVDTHNVNKRRYWNGYEIKHQMPSFKPYSLPYTGRQPQHAFSSEIATGIQPHDPLSTEQWNALVHSVQILSPPVHLREFQIECANLILSRSQDICIIAPTGQGKSLLWALPLLVQSAGCSLIITPYTSLGLEGEQRYAIHLMCAL